MTVAQFIKNAVRSDFTGNLLRLVYRGRFRFHQAFLDLQSRTIRGRIIPLVMLEKYEKEEIQLLKDHLDPNIDVVDLGSSIGGVSVNAGRLSSGRMYCFEANIALIEILQHNLKINGLAGSYVENCAIAPTNQPYVYFEDRGSNELGRLVDEPNEHTRVVFSKSVKCIVGEHRLNEFALISDIEGSEKTFILEEPESLEKCKQLFIELHLCEWRGKQYTQEDLRQAILDLGFREIQSIGSNYYFEKS